MRWAWGGSDKGWRWSDSARSEIGLQIIDRIGEGSFDDPEWKRRYKAEYDRLRDRALSDAEWEKKRAARREMERLSQQKRRQRLRAEVA